MEDQWLEPGDFDRDGQASVADLSACEGALKNLGAYQATHGPGGSALGGNQLVSIGDLTGDGLVDNADLQGLIVYLANGGPVALAQVVAVPEPPSVLLAASALGLIALCSIRLLYANVRLADLPI